MWHGGGRRTKNLQGEREREGREGRKERKEEQEKREGKRERKGEESKREMYYGCKTPPFKLSKDYKRHERGAEKSFKKAGREEEETEKIGENMVTED